ncbi:MAG: hypothetical protein AAGE52_09920 [Myxococcota bacterium]
MRIIMIFALLTGLAFAGLACGGSSDDPPPIVPEEEPTAGAEVAPEPEPTGVTEADAVTIAINLAEAEGYDLSLYSDITVHHAENGDWLVQLRRPMSTRFLEVTVHKVSGDADLTQRATSH